MEVKIKNVPKYEWLRNKLMYEVNTNICLVFLIQRESISPALENFILNLCLNVQIIPLKISQPDPHPRLSTKTRDLINSSKAKYNPIPILALRTIIPSIARR